MAQFQHNTGSAPAAVVLPPEYDTPIRIARGKKIYNVQTGRTRVIDRSIETMGKDTGDISFEYEFLHEGQRWTVAWEDV